MKTICCQNVTKIEIFELVYKPPTQRSCYTTRIEHVIVALCPVHALDHEPSFLKQNLQRLLQLPEAFPDSDVSKKKSAAFVAYEVLSDLKVFKDGD